MLFNELDPVSGYAAWSNSYDGMRNFVIDVEEPVMRQLLAGVAGASVVDAACGTGRHLAHLIAEGNVGVGVDQSIPMLEAARQKIPNADLRVGQLNALPVEDAWADLVICSLALTHVVALEVAACELARVVRPGGRIVISDVHPFFTALGFHAFFGEGRFVRNYHHPHGDYLDAFAAAGLSVLRCIEPRWTPEAVADQRFVAAVPEAGRQALVGLPLILIWALERPL